jgi:hypothetical protein
MDAILSSLCQHYAVENIVIVDDPAQLPVSSHSNNPTQVKLSIIEAPNCTAAFVSSIYDDMAQLIKWGEKSFSSSRKSKQYIKQCRWSGSNSVTIAPSRNRLAAPVNIKKDVSPTRPTRR